MKTHSNTAKAAKRKSSAVATNKYKGRRAKYYMRNARAGHKITQRVKMSS